MEEYIRVKECITENQTMDDLCVLNYEDEILRPFGEKLMAEKKVQVMYFSSLRALKDGIYYQDGEIRIAKNGETELLTRTAYIILKTSWLLLRWHFMQACRWKLSAKSFRSLQG